jgi:4-amino-4-deoxy-L-arabinose transferase-like glycosyltransferase
MVVLPGLGSSSRLTYHEAFVAQGAREMLGSGNWAYPTIGGLPWLEKPPLPWWLVSMLGYCSGTVNALVARVPSSLAVIGLVVGVGFFAAYHYGPNVGLLAGCIQATTGWTVTRGRLAEADILLVCLVTWVLIAFDRLLVVEYSPAASGNTDRSGERWRLWRWVFFVLLGTTSLVKGIGFGAALVLSVVGVFFVWQRDWVSLQRLHFPVGWVLAGVISLTWPVFMLAQHGHAVLALWSVHVLDRLLYSSGPGGFAGEPGWEYGLSVLSQGLPWTPLAVIGLWRSVLLSLEQEHNRPTSKTNCVPAIAMAGNRLLCVWGLVPLALITLARVKNAHYALCTQVPWSIWAALAMAKFGKLAVLRGYNSHRLIKLTGTGFITLALGYGLENWLLGPYVDRRGSEWAFYQTIGEQIPPDIPLILLYDEWDREPYQTPFGHIPHDLAVRLFYLGRLASWCRADNLSTVVRGKCGAVISRDRNRLALEQLGQLEFVAQSPRIRFDRAYSLFRLIPSPVSVGNMSKPCLDISGTRR